MEELESKIRDEMLRIAIAAMANAYVPYISFRVGAAVLGNNEKIYPGCNVQHSISGMGSCAERTALCNGITDGARSFSAVVVVSQGEDYVSPCGMCRQALLELADITREDMLVYTTRKSGLDPQLRGLSFYLPNAFDPRKAI